MNCGIISIKIVPITKDLQYIRHCNDFKKLPFKMQSSIENIIDFTNKKFKDYILFPIDVDINPICLTIPSYESTISNNIYYEYHKMMLKYDFYPSIRCSYTIGEIINPYSNTKDIQGEGLTKIKNYLNLSNDAGLYPI